MMIDCAKPCCSIRICHLTRASYKKWSAISSEDGHSIQDTIPVNPRTFTLEVQKSADLKTRMEAMEQNAERYYNQTVHPLPNIKQGSQMVLHNPTTGLWNTYAVVISVDLYHKCLVKTKDGSMLIRNCKFYITSPTLSPPYDGNFNMLIV